MVQVTTISALAALCFRANAVAIRQSQEYKPAIGLPAVTLDKALPLFDGVTPQYINVRLEDLVIPANATAPPSAGVLAELAARSEEEKKRAIINGESRRIPPNSDYPYKTMGKVFWSNGVFCS